jgi:hypothetical protein
MFQIVDLNQYARKSWQPASTQLAPVRHGPLVLVADDSEISCEIVVALLARRGLRADVAPGSAIERWQVSGRPGA